MIFTSKLFFYTFLSFIHSSEAVNLELININNNNNNGKKQPETNGKNNNNELPMKKDVSDVEMGTKKDEYEEYFVPVNEHRKYMR
jgi:hypothetical protein